MGFVETETVLPGDDEVTQFCKFGFPYDCPSGLLTKCEGIRCSLNGVLIRKLSVDTKPRGKFNFAKGDRGRRKGIRNINFK